MGISVASYEEYDNMTPTERKDALIAYIEIERKVLPIMKKADKQMEELKPLAEELLTLADDLEEELKPLAEELLTLADDLEEMEKILDD